MNIKILLQNLFQHIVQQSKTTPEKLIRGYSQQNTYYYLYITLVHYTKLSYFKSHIQHARKIYNPDLTDM